MNVGPEPLHDRGGWGISFAQRKQAAMLHCRSSPKHLADGPALQHLALLRGGHVSWPVRFEMGALWFGGRCCSPSKTSSTRCSHPFWTGEAHTHHLQP